MKKEYVILFVIFLLTLNFRMILSLQADGFSSDSAYYNLRHTDYISENTQPMIYDELSYSGRYILDTHIFHYALAGLRAFLPDFFIFKILPEILFALLVFIVYAVAKTLTENSTAAMLSALISGFIPIFVSNSVNTISIYSIVLPLIFYQLFCLMNLETHKGRFIVLSFLLPLIHPFTAILALAFLFYAVLLSIESIRIKKQVKEAVIFFVMLVLLISFIFYKKVFLALGLNALLQNVPSALFASYFQGVNVFSLIYNIGIIPLILGALGIIFGIAWEKNDFAFLLSALVLADFALLFLKLINFNLGMMFLGILLAIFSATAISKAIKYVNITKFARHKNAIFVAFVILIAATLFFPSYSGASNAIKAAPSADEINALAWISHNTPKNSIVLGNIDEGNLIAYASQRKTVADNVFMFAPDRYDDVYTMLTSESLVKSTNLMHNYGVGYIFISEKTKQSYNMEDLNNADSECYKMEHESKKAKIYKFLC
ncbi:MAG: hypothetical protein KJ955_00920 [Nanoarchaeota archaeon]|nr:hypothetical protein [Nanoarchaeota archaeon]